MNSSQIRVRFAPSPTGHLHVGGARTALFNWLYARKTGGTFVLRIEDTDAERSTKESYDAILDGLKWLGLDWDEGPEKGGDFGPYVQSARSIIYQHEADRLLEEGKAYRCFCTPEELDELRSEAIAAGKPPRYDLRCRRLPPEEVAARVARNVPHVLRFRIDPGETKFFDIVRGEFNFSNSELDDFVIRRSDGRPTYNFAVVVDDAKMQISHVIRGDDHLSNTPKQVLVSRALGYRLPKYAHLPMILGADRQRLSKRHGATSIQDYRAAGYSPDGLMNYLALLGWSLDGTSEFFTPQSLIEKFSLKRVSKNPAAFDENKLRHINSEHFKRLDAMQKVTLVYARLIEDGVFPPDFSVPEWSNGNADTVAVDPADAMYREEVPRLGFIMNVMGNRLSSLAEATETLRYFYKDDYTRDQEAIEKHLSGPAVADRLSSLADALDAVEKFRHEEIEAAVRGLADVMGVKAGELIHPSRVALTGKSVSPDIFAVIQLLGRQKSTERLRAVASEVSARAGGA